MERNQQQIGSVGFKAVSLILIAGFATTVASASDFVPGEILVKYRSDVSRSQNQIQSLYSSVGVKKIRRFARTEMGQFEHLKVDLNQDIKKTVEYLNLDPSVEYAQPNYIVYAPELKPVSAQIPHDGISQFNLFEQFALLKDPTPHSTPVSKPALQNAPAEVIPAKADPSLSQSYGMGTIGAQAAWKRFAGSKSFVVAVIDTGMDYNHEDLSFNVWRNSKPTNGDVVGYDFIHNDGLPFDDHLHGTHTAGTVGAVGGNGLGTAGVAPRVSVMALKFLSAEGSGSVADAVRAIDYAVAHGAKVLSNSWGGRDDDASNDNKVLSDAIERAKNANVLFIAAAGNEAANNDDPSTASYPAALSNDNIISVAATNKQDKMAYFSNYGKKTVDLAAPGVKIYSTTPGNNYANLDGTSMACPHVAGAAALIWSKKPNLTYAQVKKILLSTVTKVDGLSAKTVTGGRLNVDAALKAVEKM